MSLNQSKLPPKGGALSAMKKLRELRKKEPSNRLVQIIDEVTQQIQPDKKDKPAAAKDAEV